METTESEVLRVGRVCEPSGGRDNARIKQPTTYLVGKVAVYLLIRAA